MIIKTLPVSSRRGFRFPEVQEEFNFYILLLVEVHKLLRQTPKESIFSSASPMACKTLGSREMSSHGAISKGP